MSAGEPKWDWLYVGELECLGLKWLLMLLRLRSDFICNYKMFILPSRHQAIYQA